VSLLLDMGVLGRLSLAERLPLVQITTATRDACDSSIEHFIAREQCYRSLDEIRRCWAGLGNRRDGLYWPSAGQRAGRSRSDSRSCKPSTGPSHSCRWQIVRDVAVRVPVMVLPKWLSSRTRPVALDDVIEALIAAADLPLEQSEWFDVPGPETLSGQQILERIAAVKGRHFLALRVPLLTPRLSALWLRLITRTDFGLARELVLGLEEDLLPKDERFWPLIGHTALVSFDVAARRALAAE
jgi:hypothetical protein